MLQHKRKLSGAAVVVLALALAAMLAAVPSSASARPGGSHHESNQGEVHKPGWSWAKIVRAVKISITRPVKVIVPGGSSSPTCK
jgi:hypothetical protein